MESTTLPILCCIGYDVAGKPTQFMLDRLFAALELDWRTITVEVEEDDLVAAIEGMRAMGFSAVRFYPELYCQAAGYMSDRFSELNPLAHYVGSITSATLENACWSAWDNLGFAIRSCIAKRAETQRVAVWLHGNSRATRSTATALTSDSSWIASIAWTEHPEAQPDALKLPSLLQSSSEEDLVSQFIASVEEEEVSLVAIVAESLPESARELISKLPDGMQVLLIGEDTCELHQLHAAISLETVSQHELSIAAEAFDFERWTGQVADASILRDALDEFCDF